MKDLYSPKDVVDSGLCIGCGSCAALNAISGNPGRMEFDHYGQLKPQVSSPWYNIRSSGFSRTCPFSPAADNEDQISSKLFSSLQGKSDLLGRFIANKAGYVTEDDFRINGSSGGMVTWIATELLRKNLIDGLAHVKPADPEIDGKYFSYRISRTVKEITEGSGSRYYPVELSGVLQEIYNVPGRYAVVAIPCMIKAINLLRGNNEVFKERICITLGIFCGHMKSTKFAESFSWQMRIPFSKVQKLDYRNKIIDRPANWYNAKLILKDGTQFSRDWWHMKDGDWGAGFFMNSACNFCDDVVAETADVSAGDAWVEPYYTDGKGTNVIIIRSEMILGLVTSGIKDKRLHFEEVPAELVERTQAAGFRQRREGLAYRLTWAFKGIVPVKRVNSDAKNITHSRKRIYRMRYNISKWSHRMFRMASQMNMPWIYLIWARVVASVYYGIAYHEGKMSEMKKRFFQLR